MIKLGLTGSIGMGKSTVARMFADEGVPVFDADAVVHRLQGPEGALVGEIETHFPGTTGLGGVNRTALAEAVLGEGEKLRRLEELIHPAVRREREAFLARHSDAPLVLLDIPLLFEKDGWRDVDKIAVVSAPYEVQRQRVLARHRPGGDHHGMAGLQYVCRSVQTRHLHCFRCGKPGVAADQLDAGAGHPVGLAVVLPVRGEVVAAFKDGRAVQGAGDCFLGARRGLRSMQGRAGSKQCLRRHAGPVGTFAANQFCLHQRGGQPALHHPVRDIFTHGAGTDYYNVKFAFKSLRRHEQSLRREVPDGTA